MKQLRLLKMFIRASALLTLSLASYNSISWAYTAKDERNLQQLAAAPQTQLLNKFVSAINDIRVEATKLPGPVIGQSLQLDGINIDAVKNDIMTKIIFARQNIHPLNEPNADNADKIKKAVKILTDMRDRLVKIPGIQIIELSPNGDNVEAFLTALVAQLNVLTVSFPQWTQIALAGHYWDELYPNDKFLPPLPFKLQPYLDLYNKFIIAAERCDEKLKSYNSYFNPELIGKLQTAMTLKGLEMHNQYDVKAAFNPEKFTALLKNAISMIDILKEHITDVDTKHQLKNLGTKLNIGELKNLKVNDEPIDTKDLNKYLDLISNAIH